MAKPTGQEVLDFRFNILLLWRENVSGLSHRLRRTRSEVPSPICPSISICLQIPGGTSKSSWLPSQFGSGCISQWRRSVISDSHFHTHASVPTPPRAASWSHQQVSNSIVKDMATPTLHMGLLQEPESTRVSEIGSAKPSLRGCCFESWISPFKF